MFLKIFFQQLWSLHSTRLAQVMPKICAKICMIASTAKMQREKMHQNKWNAKTRSYCDRAKGKGRPKVVFGRCFDQTPDPNVVTGKFYQISTESYRVRNFTGSHMVAKILHANRANPKTKRAKETKNIKEPLSGADDSCTWFRG